MQNPHHLLFRKPQPDTDPLIRCRLPRMQIGAAHSAFQALPHALAGSLRPCAWHRRHSPRWRCFTRSQCKPQSHQCICGRKGTGTPMTSRPRAAAASTADTACGRSASAQVPQGAPCRFRTWPHRCRCGQCRGRARATTAAGPSAAQCRSRAPGCATQKVMLVCA